MLELVIVSKVIKFKTAQNLIRHNIITTTIVIILFTQYLENLLLYDYIVVRVYDITIIIVGTYQTNISTVGYDDVVRYKDLIFEGNNVQADRKVLT